MIPGADGEARLLVLVIHSTTRKDRICALVTRNPAIISCSL
jgi:hypothetical protein